MKTKKPTKKLFCQIYDEAKKMRRKDPIQFSVMYNEWARQRQKPFLTQLNQTK